MLPPVYHSEEEALIREARQRQRRRRRWFGVVVLVVAVALGVSLAVSGGSGKPPRAKLQHLARNASPTLQNPQANSPAPIPTVVPEEPKALAVGPKGDLYIADQQRNEVLERHPDGTFTVVAGRGVAGFSGDGGPAVDAKLNLTGGGGMAFAPDGTLYIADSGNWRVRAISPPGVISTIAGGGFQMGTWWISDGTRALDATLNLSDVAVGPGGLLYVATDQEILRLNTDGTFTRVVGTPTYGGIEGVGGPAVDASADGPDGMAFDASGNLFFTGFNTKTLHMVTPNGTMTLPSGPENFYARGAGGLAAAPDGTVIGMNTLAIDRLSPHGSKTIISFESTCPATGNGLFDGVHCFLPNGIAVGPDGTIYADTDYGNGYTDKTAIVAISKDGMSSRVLWEPSSQAS